MRGLTESRRLCPRVLREGPRVLEHEDVDAVPEHADAFPLGRADPVAPSDGGLVGAHAFGERLAHDREARDVRASAVARVRPAVHQEAREARGAVPR